MQSSRYAVQGCAGRHGCLVGNNTQHCWTTLSPLPEALLPNLPHLLQKEDIPQDPKW